VAPADCSCSEATANRRAMGRAPGIFGVCPKMFPGKVGFIFIRKSARSGKDRHALKLLTHNGETNAISNAVIHNEGELKDFPQQ